MVCALLHDVGEIITPNCHGEIAAAMLRPYISGRNHWILSHHEVYQAQYYGPAAGIHDAAGLVAQFASSPHHAACVEFCEKFDQTSFDPDYDTLPLATFAPMVRRVFAREPYSAVGTELDELSQAKLALSAAYPS